MELGSGDLSISSAPKVVKSKGIRLNLRIARAFLASDMATDSAFLRVSDKQRLAQMAVATNSLHDGLPNQILSTGTRWDGERWVLGGLRSLACLSFLRGGGSSLSFSSRFLLLGSLGDGVAGTFLAAGMLAVAADLVGTEGGLAAVAGSPDSHADWLFHSFGIPVVTWLGHPLVWFECQAVFGEQSACLLLLRVAPMTRRGGIHLLLGGGGGSLPRLLGAKLHADKKLVNLSTSDTI